MNSFKKFLIFGIALVNTNYCSTSYGAELRIGTGLEISGNDTSINHPIIVENTKFNCEDGNSQISNLTLGKDDENYDAHKITLEKNGVINQTNTGHIHVYDNLQVDPGATIKTTLYNAEHVNMLHDFDRRNINTAGFDIHGSLKEKDGEPISGGNVTFKKGSNIEFQGIKDDNAKYASPALYLCNDKSKLDVANLLTKIDKNDTDEYKKSKVTLFHVVGITDESGNRQGTVDIFTNTSEETPGFTAVINDKIKKIGDNNVLIENAKINIPVYNFEIIDPRNSEAVENQKIKITALEQAQEIGEADGEKIYDTADKTDKIVGLDIDLTKEPDITNTLKILKNNYLYNKKGKDYTLLINSYINPKTATDNAINTVSTGIKIKPKINDGDDLNKIFSLNIIDTRQIPEAQSDMRASILDFIRSISNLKGKNKSNKIKIYESALDSDYLNNKKYTLDLDKVNSNVSPFNLPPLENGKNFINLTDLVNWIGQKDNKPISILPLYVNLKGNNPNAFKLPSTQEDGKSINQIQEIDFFGNNSKFNQHIDLMEENITGDTDTHVNKLVFDENSFVRTNMPTVNQQFPINWEFIGSNDNVYQNNEFYATKINCPLTSLVVNNKNNKNGIKVQLNNPNNESAFNSYLYVNEIYNIPSSPKQFGIQEKPYSSLVISDKQTVRLVNKEKNISKNMEFIPRQMIISHIDNIPSITEFDAELDPVVKYVPTSIFLQATTNLEEQLQKYEYDTDQETTEKKYNIEFYTSIPKKEFKDLAFPVGDNNYFVNLDLTVAFDEESGNSKISFYNVMEYVYNKKYNKTDYVSGFTSKDTEEITAHNDEFSAKHPHLFIPLYRYQNKTNQYYFLTNFEIFPGFTKDTLITNFNNAMKDKIKLNTIIPNIYMGNNIIQFEDDSEIDFGKENAEFPHAKYAVYTKSTSSN